MAISVLLSLTYILKIDSMSLKAISKLYVGMITTFLRRIYYWFLDARLWSHTHVIYLPIYCIVILIVIYRYAVGPILRHAIYGIQSVHVRTRGVNVDTRLHTVHANSTVPRASISRTVRRAEEMVLLIPKKLLASQSENNYWYEYAYMNWVYIYEL